MMNMFVENSVKEGVKELLETVTSEPMIPTEILMLGKCKKRNLSKSLCHLVPRSLVF